MIDPNTLSQFAFFADLPSGMRTDIAAASRLLSLESAAVIFRTGDKADTLYGLIAGEVELSLEVRDKSLKASRISVDTARPGQVFGWSALTGRARRTVTATCSLPTQVAAFPAQNLKALCERDPTFGYLLMKRLVEIISKRLDNRSRRLIEVWVEAFGVSEVTP
jgi:CRP/FNR family cyclic AMP-dependent transcriptional regulator